MFFGVGHSPINGAFDSFSRRDDNPPDMKTSRFLLRGFRRPREIACFALGKLEPTHGRDLATRCSHGIFYQEHEAKMKCTKY